MREFDRKHEHDLITIRLPHWMWRTYVQSHPENHQNDAMASYVRVALANYESGQHRVDRRTEKATMYVMSAPIHAAILRRLALSPAAEEALLGITTEGAGTRALLTLVETGLVFSNDDGNGNFVYELTDAGEKQAAEIVAFTEDGRETVR